MSEINLFMHGDSGKSVVQELMQEIEKLRAENEELYQIAFDLAMMETQWPTEHDDMLLEDAISRAKEWWKKRETNES